MKIMLLVLPVVIVTDRINTRTEAQKLPVVRNLFGRQAELRVHHRPTVQSGC
jgi:hypothetical protein